MSREERRMVKEIREHLAKLHDAWQNDPQRDGHCKSSEGYVGVFAWYPNWFEAGDKESYLNATPKYGMEVYSYLFGPNRLHQYQSIEEAYREVLTWDY